MTLDPVSGCESYRDSVSLTERIKPSGACGHTERFHRDPLNSTFAQIISI